MGFNSGFKGLKNYNHSRIYNSQHDLSKKRKSEQLCFIIGVISSFRLGVDEKCSLLDYYAASCGSSLPTTLKDETNRLS